MAGNEGSEPPRGLGIRLGTYRVAVAGGMTTAVDDEAHGVVGDVVVAAADVAGVPADYRAEARLEVEAFNQLRGWVTGAEVTGDQVAITLRNTTQFTENLIGHLSHAHMTDTELVWSMAHWFGLTPVVPGLMPRQEVILVVMPVTGFELAENLYLDAVWITRERMLAERLVAHLLPSESRDAFVGAGAWALVEVDAVMLLGAEQTAVPLIEAAIDRLALEVQYSLAADPDGVALPFARPGLLADPVVERTVFATGRDTHRTWLRSLDHPRVTVPASARRLVLPATPDDLAWTNAMRAWRRATRETDPLTVVGAIFEAVEFYASRTTVPKILNEDDAEHVRLAIDAVGLAPDKRKRLDDVLARANEAPLRIRLLAALDADGVPYSKQEIQRLWRLRDHRNDALHGRRRGEPDTDDLDLAKGFVNRMLVFRAWKSKPTEGDDQSSDAPPTPPNQIAPIPVVRPDK